MEQTSGQKRYSLFGGDESWQAQDWTDSDDRVRGGKSQSYLECSDEIGRFYGTLDIKTLGGAGFASQRTTGEDREWDLSDYAGIEICVAKGDKKRYTFILKDKLLPPDPENGREQASISYECDFELPPQTKPGPAHERFVFIPWSSFNATYRGRLKKDAKPINLKKVKRMSIMMRSFFGAQEGDFSLSMRSISALAKAPPPGDEIPIAMHQDALEKGQAIPQSTGIGDAEWYSGRQDFYELVRRRRMYLLLGATAVMALFIFMRRSCQMYPFASLIRLFNKSSYVPRATLVEA
ncbi:uncharacterized protein MYCFIDRAFT_48226 [Pseudocercospora fijiensis CIRAD86]|uniref:NADH:ubiquinone oxidoreductase intermediate-associated protein 30 domain-containing protein n=1 Tax=Pseudocercospora fijiensis (strain CIRAD86) TaxID=383855 RepID=N1Q6I9_PSEFD|nr:uncharacterized protein MYCFIDRAFT_48226 [Pseudocercospora fijiensis CIRAD86]EME88004.1 hypothetical protein MYCFIDRAFT_48226 [Pseudocercospora fijiensis CIRAD86]